MQHGLSETRVLGLKMLVVERAALPGVGFGSAVHHPPAAVLKLG